MKAARKISSASPPGGTLIYIGIADRAAFDCIKAPCTDHGETDKGHVLSKAVDHGGLYIVFQHWIKSLTIAAVRADYEGP